MNLKAIIASLVLGSSSIALAAPAPAAAPAQASYGTTVVRDHRTGDETTTTTTTVVRDHRDDRAQAAAPNAIYWKGVPKPAVYRPVTLASGLRLGVNGRASISVGSQAGRFDTLQISASAGKTLIQQVFVQFDNGQRQVANLGRMIDGDETLRIDLAGNHRAIRRIVVSGTEIGNGRRRPYGAFTLTAS